LQSKGKSKRLPKDELKDLKEVKESANNDDGDGDEYGDGDGDGENNKNNKE